VLEEEAGLVLVVHRQGHMVVVARSQHLQLVLSFDLLTLIVVVVVYMVD
jgi:hypothetical protein